MLSAAANTTVAGLAIPTLINVGRVPAPNIKPGINPNTSGPYTPQQVQTAYGVNLISFNGTTGDGTGQTIAIVDAYNDPTIVNDTAAFNTRFGLPQFNVPGGPTFQVLNQAGGTTLPMNTNTSVGDWDLEESLDVQWAHSMAPKANIILFESNTANNSDMYHAEVTAAGWTGVSVISDRWSTGEYLGETTDDSNFLTPSGHQGVTFLASAGDSGTPRWLSRLFAVRGFGRRNQPPTPGQQHVLIRERLVERWQRDQHDGVDSQLPIRTQWHQRRQQNLAQRA
jgi:subtilase family serine protease